MFKLDKKRINTGNLKKIIQPTDFEAAKSIDAILDERDLLSIDDNLNSDLDMVFNKSDSPKDR